MMALLIISLLTTIMGCVFDAKLGKGNGKDHVDAEAVDFVHRPVVGVFHHGFAEHAEGHLLAGGMSQPFLSKPISGADCAIIPPMLCAAFFISAR